MYSTNFQLRSSLGGGAERSSKRFDRYKASQLTLTPLGKAILAGQEDFSRLNPIHRWWGGTELSGDNLWRWGAALIAPDPDEFHMIECREPQHAIDVLEPA